ncbi:UL16-binding protein 2-like [Dipodomys spectabilis]|uniref:UL16-binding protein 2-like n=1 Tax=Dipodomys spectabilis TaxID=105255 RepID=UPI001C53ECB5|nr:UL16-binding protein 2-like [Dipodomys spectabilis]
MIMTISLMKDNIRGPEVLGARVGVHHHEHSLLQDPKELNATVSGPYLESLEYSHMGPGQGVAGLGKIAGRGRGHGAAGSSLRDPGLRRAVRFQACGRRRGEREASMARAGHSGSAPRDTWILRLLCGLLCWNVADAHSLSYNITVVSRQWWYEAYGQVDQHTFLYYNSSNDTCNPVGLFGLKVIKTEAWQKQPDILKDIGDILRQQLAHIKLESGTTKGEDPCTLLGKMSCQPEGNGKISGFWQLVYNGQILLHFDSNTQQWTEVHPGSSWIKKILEEDRSVTDVFYKT